MMANDDEPQISCLPSVESSNDHCGKRKHLGSFPETKASQGLKYLLWLLSVVCCLLLFIHLQKQLSNKIKKVCKEHDGGVSLILFFLLSFGFCPHRSLRSVFSPQEKQCDLQNHSGL